MEGSKRSLRTACRVESRSRPRGNAIFLLIRVFCESTLRSDWPRRLLLRRLRYPRGTNPLVANHFETYTKSKLLQNGSQLRAGCQEALLGDVHLQVTHSAPRKHHFHDHVGAVLVHVQVSRTHGKGKAQGLSHELMCTMMEEETTNQAPPGVSPYQCRRRLGETVARSEPENKIEHGLGSND